MAARINLRQVDGSRGVIAFIVSIILMAIGGVVISGRDHLTKEIDWTDGIASMWDLFGDFIGELWSLNTLALIAGIAFVAFLIRRVLILANTNPTNVPLKRRNVSIVLAAVAAIVIFSVLSAIFNWLNWTNIGGLVVFLLIPLTVALAVAIGWNKDKETTVATLDTNTTTPTEKVLVG